MTEKTDREVLEQVYEILVRSAVSDESVYPLALGTLDFLVAKHLGLRSPHVVQREREKD